MSNINSIVISGRLARDPELKHTPSGTAIAEFTIACGQKWKDQTGADKESTAWIGCNVFGPRAEFASKYLKKGLRANVQGQLVTEEWTDKASGQKRSKTKVKVMAIEPIDWPDRQQQTQPAPPDMSRNQTPTVTMDDVPF